MDDSKEKQQKILPLSYGLGLVKELVPVPTHIFKSDNHYYEKFDREEVDEWNVLKTDYEFRKKILKEVKEKNIVIINEEQPVLFGGVKCTDDLFLVIGPVVITQVDQNFTKLYALKHKANNVSLFYIDVKKLASILLLIYSSITDKYIFLSDFLDKSFLNDELLESAQKHVANIFSR